MSSTTESIGRSAPPPGPTGNGSSAAARWISGVGAFLLVAAAATFVAVRWEEIPEKAKFGALVAATVTCLGVDRWLRGRLPITGSAFFHIGVLLVPIDVAAVGVWRGWDWPGMLLAQGVAITGACGAGGWRRRSVVLLAATWLGVVLLASGVGAATGLSPALLLASGALVAALVPTVVPAETPGRAGQADRHGAHDQPRRRRVLDRAGFAWATLAGLAVPLAAAQRLGLPGAGVLSELGLATPAPHPLAVVTGMVAALALFLVARRWQSVPVALVGVASLLTGAITTWAGIEPGAEESLVAAAACLLAAEVVAWVVRRDPFWCAPADLVARSGEAIAGLLTIYAAGVLSVAPWPSEPRPTAALAAGLVTLAWLACLTRSDRPGRADARRFWPWTSVPVGLSGAVPLAAAVTGSTAVVLLTDVPALRATFVVIAGGLATLVAPTAFPGAAVNRPLAAGLLAWAPVIAYREPALAVGLGLVGGVVLALATADTARYSVTSGRMGTHDTHGDPDPSSGPARFNRLAYNLVVLSLAPPAVGWFVSITEDTAALGTGSLILTAWLVAAVLDRASLAPEPADGTEPVQVTYEGEPPRPLPLAMIARCASLVPMAVVPAAAGALFTASEALVIAVLFGVLALVDATRLDQPNLLVGTGVAVPIGLASAVFMAEGTIAEASVALTLAALVWLGTSAAVPERWALPAALSGAVAGGAGFLLGSEDAWATSINLLTIGTGLVMAGVATGDLRWSVAGYPMTILGIWWQLSLNEVTWSELYVAPVALALWAVGYYSRREMPMVSSWLAYTPTVVALGGSAMLERLTAGSSGWHAVVAGGVGVAAVAAGGLWRQAGPLFTGTALVVAVTAHETLETAPQVPTWAWLAAGGATLLGLGIMLERRGTGPLEAGRRLVDLVDERFS